MSNTVDYGIDLGTTNSAVARMTSKGAEVVQIRGVSYIASAVAIDKRGQLKVGAEALNPNYSEHLARWFKRNMGTQNTLDLGSGQPWTPEALSSEVLKALKAAVKLKTNEDLTDVVITVPAMFTQPQCAATHLAAELAGLNAVTLLQEPIAAATAYLSDDPAEGYYLVYDLGGGTFDASLIRLRSGEMNVVEHGGDNYLGGSDFDRAIFDWAIEQIEHAGGDVNPFQKPAQRTQLLIACEDARIALSDSDRATIYLDDFDLPVAKLDLTRTNLEDLVEALVTRSIDLSRDRILAASLTPGDIQSILLVGGPTQMPYIRKRLRDALGIRLNLDQDPMTVVAKGAAIHAGTMLTHADAKAVSHSAINLDLFYDPVSPESVTTLAGKVTAPQVLVGEVKIITSSGDWETGWIPLVNSAFKVDVTLGRGQITEFAIHLRDNKGQLVASNPPSFSIRSGVRSAPPVTPYCYGVVLEGGLKVKPIVAANVPLPASGYHEFALAKALVAGSPEALNIYFVEGTSPLADENSKVGELSLKGTDIRRTLKENEKVEIRIRMDEGRRLKATVHIPFLDEDFLVPLYSMLEAPDCADLEARLVETRYALSGVEDYVEEQEQEVVMRAGRQIEQLEATMDRVEKGEVGEADRIHKQLSDTKAAIRPLLDKYNLQAKHARVIEFIGESETLCREFHDEMGLAKLQDAREDADKALRLKRDKELDAVRDRVREIFWEHYGKTPECWEYQVQLMHERAALASDQATYHELVRKAEASLRERDYDGVRLQALRAFQMLPEAEKMRNRFHDAALR